MQPVHHLGEENQGLHRLCHTLCGGYHPLSQDCDIFTAVFHRAGCQLNGSPQLIQALLPGQFYRGLLQHPARSHGARWSRADARALGSRKTWLKVGAFLKAALYAKTGRIRSAREQSGLTFSRVVSIGNREKKLIHMTIYRFLDDGWRRMSFQGKRDDFWKRLFLPNPIGLWIDGADWFNRCSKSRSA